MRDLILAERVDVEAAERRAGRPGDVLRHYALLPGLSRHRHPACEDLPSGPKEDNQYEKNDQRVLSAMAKVKSDHPSGWSLFTLALCTYEKRPMAASANLPEADDKDWTTEDLQPILDVAGALPAPGSLPNDLQ